jgi:hypothetical protein
MHSKLNGEISLRLEHALCNDLDPQSAGAWLKLGAE